MDYEQISVRIDTATKAQAEAILAALSLSPTDAVRMFYKQVILQQGLPFAVKLPESSNAPLPLEDYQQDAKKFAKKHSKTLDELSKR